MISLAIQTAFSWANCHYYKFTIMGEDSTGPFQRPIPGAGSIKHSNLFENHLSSNKDIEYKYDFGDPLY